MNTYFRGFCQSKSLPVISLFVPTLFCTRVVSLCKDLDFWSFKIWIPLIGFIFKRLKRLLTLIRHRLSFLRPDDSSLVISC